MNFNKFFDSPLFYKIVALVFAVLLFSYTNEDKLSSTRNNTDSTMLANASATMKVGLQLEVNSNKYFVTGYPENVKVKVSGSKAMITTLTNTRNFKIYADLTDLKAGTHEVTLKQSGLNSDVDYTISPRKIKVTISPRKTKSFPVQVSYDRQRVANNYKIGSSTASPDVVSVTGAASQVDKIADVVAAVQLSKGKKQTFNQSVLLQAIDDKGKILNVVISPQTVNVKIPIYSEVTTKKVPIQFIASGNGEANKNYNFSSSIKTVTLSGTKSQLDGVSSYKVTVPIGGISSTTTKNITLSSLNNGVAIVQPKSLDVKISVTDDTSSQTDNSVSETSSSSATSSESNLESNTQTSSQSSASNGD
ncbi:YbbR-like domain-containing protein [Liquorilactobacillus cacaonum]|uniref:YbbR family protein n=1 Tax=Liquorilactobacillus cacaonum DSM 21116 TaxID=1423729 RepID=A0A0R2CIS7_9LACO|nr:CdaR family protein [Liquorilactobacillus cacaonum]KRM91518.1 YbbR family protein [Liquorilactobacillus cacaonum DSM 21116]